MHDVYQQDEIDVLSRKSVFLSSMSIGFLSTYDGDESSAELDFGPNHGLFRQFAYSLYPIEEHHSDNKTSNRINKVLAYLKAPVVFLLLVFIPVVDYEEENHGWSKLLNCLQIILLPAVCSMALSCKF